MLPIMIAPAWIEDFTPGSSAAKQKWRLLRRAKPGSQPASLGLIFAWM
jgi:hypothetical protein